MDTHPFQTLQNRHMVSNLPDSWSLGSVHGPIADKSDGSFWQLNELLKPNDGWFGWVGWFGWFGWFGNNTPTLKTLTESIESVPIATINNDTIVLAETMPDSNSIRGVRYDRTDCLFNVTSSILDTRPINGHIIPVPHESRWYNCEKTRSPKLYANLELVEQISLQALPVQLCIITRIIESGEFKMHECTLVHVLRDGQIDTPGEKFALHRGYSDPTVNIQSINYHLFKRPIFSRR